MDCREYGHSSLVPGLSLSRLTCSGSLQPACSPPQSNQQLQQMKTTLVVSQNQEGRAHLYSLKSYVLPSCKSLHTQERCFPEPSCAVGQVPWFLPSQYLHLTAVYPGWNHWLFFFYLQGVLPSPHRAPDWGEQVSPAYSAHAPSALWNIHFLKGQAKTLYKETQEKKWRCEDSAFYIREFKHQIYKEICFLNDFSLSHYWNFCHPIWCCVVLNLQWLAHVLRAF